MIKAIVIAIVLCSMSWALYLSYPGLAYSPMPHGQGQDQAQKITEDDPRWDCRTMGNKLCGPDSMVRPGGGFW